MVKKNTFRKHSLSTRNNKKEKRASTKKAKQAKKEAANFFAIILFNVKLNFTNLSPAEQVMKTREIVGKMTGNPHFPSPDPGLPAMLVAARALEVAEGAMDRSRAKTIVRNARRKELEEMMGLLQDYVQYASRRNASIIISSGMDVKDAKTPVGYLPATEWIIGKNGGLDGTAELRWKKVPKNKGYRVEATTDPAQGWPLIFEATKASIKLSDLTPGAVYYFRIATLSNAGYDGYSQIFMIRINLPAY